MPRLSNDEIKAIAKEAKKEHLAEKVVKSSKLVTEGAKPLESNASPVTVIGITKKDAVPDENIAKIFRKTPIKKVGWVEMTDEEVASYQEQGLLIGHDPIEGLGLLKKA